MAVPPLGALASLTDRERVITLAAASAGLGVLEFDSAHGLLRLDEAAARHHGLDPNVVASPSAFALDAWLSRFSERDRASMLSLLDRGVPAGDVARYTVKLPTMDPANQALLELSFLMDPVSRQLLGSSRDITAERSREALRRQKSDAEQASRAKTEFMSQVSHELRTPLHAILGFTELMRMDSDEPLPAQQQERLRLVQHSSQRLLDLIDQLLQIGKVEQGKRSIRLRNLPVAEIVTQCVDSLRIMAQQLALDIELELPEAGVTVRADAQAFEQVLSNLLSNALKYNREGGRVRVRVRVRNDDIEITVDDTGRGLSDSQLGRLFEPFNRFSAERSGIPGTGLGLVITRQLVKAMGGRLEVWSKQGTGSRFQVLLPQGKRSRASAPATLPLDLPSRWDTGVRRKVLYIEDDDVNVVLMRQLFSLQPDWELLVATTAAEGVSAARTQQPELILLDLNLPDASGQDVLKMLRADRRTAALPCVAVSADAMPEHIDRMLKQGFDDYWTKPLDLRQTIDRLKKRLR